MIIASEILYTLKKTIIIDYRAPGPGRAKKAPLFRFSGAGMFSTCAVRGDWRIIPYTHREITLRQGAHVWTYSFSLRACGCRIRRGPAPSLSARKAIFRGMIERRIEILRQHRPVAGAISCREARAPDIKTGHASSRCPAQANPCWLSMLCVRVEEHLALPCRFRHVF